MMRRGGLRRIKEVENRTNSYGKGKYHSTETESNMIMHCTDKHYVPIKEYKLQAYVTHTQVLQRAH